MAVTLPFVLLLLDYWPLGRLPDPADGAAPFLSSLRSRAAEKVPFLLLSAASSAVTVAAQRAGGSLVAQERLPLAERLGNGAISYVSYVAKAAWPHPLAAFYPFPPSVPWGEALACAAALAAVSAAAVAARRRAPWLFTGWFWFAGVLFPVSGLVQAGSQAMADRYAYLPAVGLFVIAAWGGHALLSLAGREKGLLPAVAGAAAVAAAAAATLPAELPWRSDEALFSHAAAVVPGNWFAEGNLGVALNRAGRPAEAEGRLRAALRYNPRYRDGRYNLAVVLDRLGRPGEAEAEYRAVLAEWPRHALSLNNLAFLLAGRGERGEAIDLYRRALAAQPRFQRARVNLGAALLSEGRVDEAVAELDAAVKANPSDPAALYQGAMAWKRKGRPDEAERLLRELSRLAPGNEAVRRELESLPRGGNGGPGRK
jgi:tetratricopeptide (TPR) repeat protein